IEHLGSREGIAKAKLEIKAGLKEGGLLIIDGDEVLMEKEHEQEHVLSCGFTQTNEYIVTNVDITEEETKFFVNDVPFTIPLVGKNDVTLINDAENASPTSIKAEIEVTKQLKDNKKKIIVLGDILE